MIENVLDKDDMQHAGEDDVPPEPSNNSVTAPSFTARQTIALESIAESLERVVTLLTFQNTATPKPPEPAAKPSKKKAKDKKKAKKRK